jgi:hypothetical protein
MMMRSVNWDAEHETLGIAITFPSFPLARGDKATQRFVMLVPSTSYDILEIFTEIHVVNACKYPFPFNRCYEFTGTFLLKEPTSLDRNFAYRKNAADEPIPISDDALRSQFDYRVFQTTQMIVLRGGTIFKRP